MTATRARCREVVLPHRNPHLGISLPQPPHDPLQLQTPPLSGPRFDERSRAHNKIIATEGFKMRERGWKILSEGYGRMKLCRINTAAWFLSGKSSPTVLQL